ncbi:MAG: DUF3226 domain-containing protein [Crocosphaera sp.]
MSNVIIVEAENDATFIKAMVKYMNHKEDNNFMIHIDNHKGYTTLKDPDNEKYRGLSETTLTRSLQRVKKRLEKEFIQKVGIIIDIDQKLQQERLNLVNKSIENIFTEAETITNINQLVKIITIDQQDIQAACYFMNVNGEGNLDTVLKKIKNHESIYADCLESWKECVEAQNKKVRPQDFDKVWINNYLRYDTCTNKEKGDANAKCSYNEKGFKYIMENKSNIWNFEHPILEDLKTFLALFETET